MRPKLLDLFCGAGGASAGYHRAGFDVTGVDVKPQPRYPFRFVRGDALEYLAAHGHEFDAVAASPPCFDWSTLAANDGWRWVRMAAGRHQERAGRSGASVRDGERARRTHAVRGSVCAARSSGSAPSITTGSVCNCAGIATSNRTSS